MVYEEKQENSNTNGKRKAVKKPVDAGKKGKAINIPHNKGNRRKQKVARTIRTCTGFSNILSFKGILRIT